MAEEFGYCVELQLRVEKYFDNLDTIGPLPSWILGEVFANQFSWALNDVWYVKHGERAFCERQPTTPAVSHFEPLFVMPDVTLWRRSAKNFVLANFPYIMDVSQARELSKYLRRNGVRTSILPKRCVAKCPAQHWRAKSVFARR